MEDTAERKLVESVAKMVADKCHGKRKPGTAIQRYSIIFQAAAMGAQAAIMSAGDLQIDSEPVERVFEPYPGAFDGILGTERTSHADLVEAVKTVLKAKLTIGQRYVGLSGMTSTPEIVGFDEAAMAACDTYRAHMSTDGVPSDEDLILRRDAFSVVQTACEENGEGLGIRDWLNRGITGIPAQCRAHTALSETETES